LAEDELSAPLGTKKRKPPSRLPVLLPRALAGVLALSIVGVGVWAATVNDPLGGEPMAIALDTARGGAPKPGDGAQGGGIYSRHDGGAAGPRTASAEPSATPDGAKTVNIIDGSSGKSQQIVLGGPADSKPAPSIDQRLLETTRHGAIPKVGPDGARPSTIYAKPLKVAAKTDGPRIALIVTGLGISAAATADAMKLPGAVTLAFTPYGNDLEKLVGRARADHEVLLQAPMEPFDYPDNDPGPQTLLTSLSAEQNVDRLQWLMSRFQGYVGIANYMGARFTASEASLAPVLRETSKRGLIFVDDGTSPRSLASQMAGSANVPFAKTDVVIDAAPGAVDVERALGRLEAMARERGTAVGTAAASPAVIARLADWAKRIESRGVVLVPITAVAIKAKSS
jgi:polysaccharide deacetylase 2 family uncharacterized protein YibQ